MAQTLAEFWDGLQERDLMWPSVPGPKPLKVTPSIGPLPGIRAVLWDVYGTLLRIPDPEFTLFPEQELRLQIALDKTIHEFHMWNHMYRKPGPPWQSMIGQYQSACERLAMVAPAANGDLTAVDLVDVWEEIVDRLFDKDYHYDESLYGSLRPYCEKIAFFFHRNLQATAARPGAAQAMTDVAGLGLTQGLLADSQCFTLTQLLADLSNDAVLPPLHELLRTEAMTMSHEFGIRKPSRTLFEISADRLKRIGIEPNEVLYISCRMTNDLAPAKKTGFRTALLAAEKVGVEAPAALIKSPETRPDRLLSAPDQLTEILQG